MDYQKIGEYIKEKRKAAGLTQAELSEKLNITSKAVSKWECGIAMPDISLFPELCQIFNITVKELLEGQDDKKDNKLEESIKKKKLIIKLLSIFCTILFILALILGIYFIKNHNNVRKYDLISYNSDFNFDGKIISIGDENYVYIGNVKMLILTKNNKNSYIGLLKYELYYGKELISMKEFENLESQSDGNKKGINNLIDRVYLFENFNKRIHSGDEELYLKIYMLNNKNIVESFTINIKIK